MALLAYFYLAEGGGYNYIKRGCKGIKRGCDGIKRGCDGIKRGCDGIKALKNSTFY